ncbi:MAG: hypothetical protein M1827_000236 [Pycnora praestabilis]|nr:MAG: hypothetical protein M1827_000236 [Pycnora praestabilis]
MHDGRPHPLLAQIPLTVSPFVSLPTATTLPYTYKSIPSTLPQSSTGDTVGSEKPKYVVSSAGYAAHPDEIIANCRALQAHLKKLQDDADKTLREWEDGIKERELAEKRRVAPGWLDREEKILEPERTSTQDIVQRHAMLAGQHSQQDISSITPSNNQINSGQDSGMIDGEGEQLDRAFGGLGLR